MWAADADVEAIAEALNSSRGSVYRKAAELGLGRRRARGRPPKPGVPVSNPTDPSGHRRHVGRKHQDGGGPRVTLEPWHPAARNGGTIYGKTVVPAAHLPQLLKEGENSRKIGDVVAKGRWMDMPLYTLTLEERATCPRTCKEWLTCYGNNMHMAQRILDDGTLERRLWGELASLSARWRHGFVVRLHVLGDFYSVGYVRFWRQALIDFPPLRIFGFTARQPSDPIGAAVVRMMAADPDRVAMRISGAGHETHCAEVVDRAADATGLLCPAQSDEKRCCATCGLCWQTDKTISFVRH